MSIKHGQWQASTKKDLATAQLLQYLVQATQGKAGSLSFICSFVATEVTQPSDDLDGPEMKVLASLFVI